MASKLKNTIKKCGFLYRALTNLKASIIKPVLDGHFAYYIRYLLTLRGKEKKLIREEGYSSVKPIMSRDWRIGHGRDGAFRRYYSAELNGKKCFIKVGFKDATVKNELEIMKNLGKPLPFSPALQGYSDELAPSTVMLAVEYIEGMRSFSLPSSNEDFSLLCGKFIGILDVLEARGLVHADVHKGNLMLKGDELMLLDYGISKMDGEANCIDYVSRPGTYYLTSGPNRTYDDAYSFVKMMEALEPGETRMSCPEMLQIKERIGKHCFTVSCPEKKPR